MSGPSPMSLGGIAFQAMGFGYTDLSRNLATPHAALEVANAFEVLQWTGPKSEDITIKGAVFPEAWGGMDSLEALRARAKAGRVMTLATADGTIRGSYVIEGIDDEHTVIDARGTPRKASYTIKLKHRGRGQASFGVSVGGISISIGF